MMNDDKNKRIDLLKRKNLGRRKINEFKSDINARINVSEEDYEILDLESSDELINKFNSSFYSCENKEIECIKVKTLLKNSVVDNIISKLSSCFSNKLFLIRLDSVNCGIVKIDSEKFFPKYNQLIDLDGEELKILSLDLKNGLLLEYTIESGIEYYYLWLWGSDWVEIANRL